MPNQSIANDVLMVWDFYDGVCTGIANFEGVAHYFDRVLDRETDEYTQKFILKTVDADILGLAIEQWKIYREWEKEFHLGNRLIESHPGRYGVNERYLELQTIIMASFKIKPISHTLYAEFYPRPNQPPLPNGCIKELLVDWSSTAS